MNVTQDRFAKRISNAEKRLNQIQNKQTFMAAQNASYMNLDENGKALKFLPLKKVPTKNDKRQTKGTSLASPV